VDAPRSVAELASVEPDHVYVFVSYGAEGEAESLRALGFHVDTAVTKHSGGGTASRSYPRSASPLALSDPLCDASNRLNSSSFL
jgi:hypothetical protein